MEPKFVLPSPKFDDETKSSLENFSKLHKPHFSTPMGMQLPKRLQPPPMFGPRGPTIPPKFLHPKKVNRQPMQPRKPAQEKPPVSNWDAFCEICDIEFKDIDELENHKRDHRKCEVDGCKFVGPSRFMNKHLETIHVSGLFERMKKARESEKTEIWRAERKRRYPTKENILLRMQAQEERFKRGERIEEPKSKFGEKTSRFPNESPSRKRKRGTRKKACPKAEKRKNLDEIEENSQYKKFKGTSDLVEYRPPSKGLSLIADYGSDSDETDEDENQHDQKLGDESTSNPTKENNTDEGEKICAQEQDQTTSTLDQDTLDGSRAAELDKEMTGKTINESSHNEGKKVEDEPPKKTPRHRKKRTNKNPNLGEASKPIVIPPPIKKSLLDYSKLRRAPQNTLLEKLIQPDIRHERNVLLQCVRYVVTNNFFGIGSAKESTSKAESLEENDKKINII